MGLFSIFKKRSEPEIVAAPTDSIKGIVDGILFEDGAFLKWGSDIEAEKLYIKKEFRADRTIYHWGERAILNGLSVYYKTVCWNHKQHNNFRSFESIEFSAEGSGAEDKFNYIKHHIERLFGQAKNLEEMHPGDVSLEWKLKAIRISLKLFNKEQPKLIFEVMIYY